jgi:hypothetical protein
MLNTDGRPAAARCQPLVLHRLDRRSVPRLTSRRLEVAHAQLAGASAAAEGIEFEQDIEDMFYGARQFWIRHLNGYHLYFIQSL